MGYMPNVSSVRVTDILRATQTTVSEDAGHSNVSHGTQLTTVYIPKKWAYYKPWLWKLQCIYKLVFFNLFQFFLWFPCSSSALLVVNLRIIRHRISLRSSEKIARFISIHRSEVFVTKTPQELDYTNSDHLIDSATLENGIIIVSALDGGYYYSSIRKKRVADIHGAIINSSAIPGSTRCLIFQWNGNRLQTSCLSTFRDAPWKKRSTTPRRYVAHLFRTEGRCRNVEQSRLPK